MTRVILRSGGAVLVLFAAALVLLGGPADGSPRPARSAGYDLVTAGQATRFHVDAELAADGSVRITEHISWEFPAGESRHGIERFVTVRAGSDKTPGRYRYYALSNVGVTSPTGAPTDLLVTDDGAFKRIRVGDPSRTVSGTQDYVVSYTLGSYVNDIGDGTAEFYDNLIDPANTDVYRNVTASVTAPQPATKAACFYAKRGATTACEAMAGGTSRYRAPDVAAGQGVSILASYPRSAFTTLSPDLRAGSAGSADQGSFSTQTASWLNHLQMGLGILFPTLAAAGMALLVWSRGRDEAYAGLTPGLAPGLGQAGVAVPVTRQPTAAVQFTPPAGVQPGMVGTIIDERADLVDVTGTLIDLAVRGYLTIGRVDGGTSRTDDWELTRTRPPATAAPLAPYEQQLLDGVFQSADVVRLSGLRDHLATTLASVRSAVYEEVVGRGWFRRSPEAQRRGWQGLGMAVGVAGLVVIGALRGAGSGVVVLGAGVVLAGLVIAALGRRMAARTAQGSAVLAQSRGFEEYLRTADAETIRWEEAQDVFSRYLPYAIVFGLAERWAAVFQQVAAAAAAGGHPLAPPLWYVGAWDAMNGFGTLAAGMDDFSTTAAGTFVSTPGSSGSSGFSIGGGFSGGGGGGSMGGSW